MDQCSEDIIKNLSREIDIMSHLNHPSILQYIGYSPSNFKNKPKPVIITELAQNGSLADILELERKGIGNHNWDDTKKLINIYGIASAMKYLHEKNIIHRDLKPGNILLDENLYPKVADFGLSKFLNDDDECNSKNKQNINKSGFVGTYSYSAPEIIKQNKYGYYGDVYAFGLIVYEIVTNEIPFKINNIYQFFNKLNNGYRPEFIYPVPYCYKKLIIKCWSDSYDQRPYFLHIVDQLENDPSFITQNVNKDEYLDYISYVKDNIFNKDDNKVAEQNKKEIIRTSKIESSNASKINELENDNIQKIKEIDNDETNNDIFIDLSNYEKHELISKCDFSKIYKFQEKKTKNIYSGQMSLVKINKLSDNDISNLSQEIKIISELNHPSLLKFIGYSPTDFKKNRKPVIITEYALNGSLNDILQIERMKNSIQGWDNTKKLINIYGIASGMSYLHSHGIIHRCLKPSAIYLNDILFPKIGDFGLSMKFYNAENLSLQSVSGLQGSPVYSAPEVLLSNAYSKSSDVYSFGFIIYEILSNEIPFKNIDNFNQILIEVVTKGNRPELTDKIPKKFRELIEKCWNQDPDQRPTFEDISYYLKMDPALILDNVNKENYQKYIEYIDEQTKLESQSLIKEKENENSSKEDQIDVFISSKNMKGLMNFLNSNCDNEIINSAFDKCFNKSKGLFTNLCLEGILINHPVAHHKYALSLIFDNQIEQAVIHLKESIKQNFNVSYFTLSRVYFEIYKNYILAFKYAKEGSNKNEKYSKCLLGYFISHGIGVNKDFMKGVEIILNSNADDFYQLFATDIGIYYANLNKRKEAYKWFKKAFDTKKTKATINNYSICFLEGIGVDKNIEKGKEILLYKSDPISSLKFYKQEDEPIFDHAQSKNDSQIVDVKTLELLVKKYSNENDAENVYKYICMLVKTGNCDVPIEYALILYKSKKFEQAFKYFSFIAEVNHPIAKHFIGIMKFYGQGCNKNIEEGYKILNELADKGIERSKDFLEDISDQFS